MKPSIGYYCHSVDTVQNAVSQCLKNSFDFAMIDLTRDQGPEFIPVGDISIEYKILSLLVIFIPKREYLHRENIRNLERELQYAKYIGIYNVVIECPDGLQSVQNMATVINRILTSDPCGNENSMVVTLMVPVTPNQALVNLHLSQPLPVDEDGPWAKWNLARMLIESPSRFFLALDMNGELPDEERTKRWLGEPITLVMLPTSMFLTNPNDFPVLSAAMKEFFCQLNFRVAGKFSFILKGNNLHGHLCHYAQYLNNFKQSENFQDKLAPYYSGYEDYLQIPLQPLRDNLDSATYDTFERDKVKYQQYQKAIVAALNDFPDEEMTVMVLGAGRGPLVDKVLTAAKITRKYVTIFAVEKNVNAIVTLKCLKDLKWGSKQGLEHGIVEIVNCDMRHWDAPKRADLIVSELLGSFGDNELSPECLDGVWRYCHSKTISIPRSYSSYLCPIQSNRLHKQLAKDKMSHPSHNPFDCLYVVHFRNCYFIDQPKKVFTFEHVDLTRPPSERDNNRCEFLSFQSVIKATCHGFAGYFDCHLYDDVYLSIVPSTQNEDMYSWFPIYFPIETPIVVQADEMIQLHITRNVNDQSVWYEWTVIQPTISKIHNAGGRHNGIALN